LETVPVRVDNVHIQGLGRTKDDYVTQAVNELFKAASFNEVIFIKDFTQKLQQQMGVN
jgi:hypothetical protein